MAPDSMPQRGEVSIRPVPIDLESKHADPPDDDANAPGSDRRRSPLACLAHPARTIQPPRSQATNGLRATPHRLPPRAQGPSNAGTRTTGGELPEPLRDVERLPFETSYGPQVRRGQSGAREGARRFAGRLGSVEGAVKASEGDENARTRTPAARLDQADDPNRRPISRPAGKTSFLNTNSIVQFDNK